MAAKTRAARTTRTSKRVARKRSGPTARLRKRSTKRVEPDVVQAALAAFAHEVRTPLTGILAISDLLATSDLGERERRWADTIKAGAEHLANLATLFVDAARTGKGTGKGIGGGSSLRQDLFDLRTLARNAGDSLAGRAAAKGLQAEVDISEKLPGLVVGDPVRLRAALENLIDNAVKFTEHGGVALTVAPWRSVKSKDKTKSKGKAKGKGSVGVAFAVSDSGIGLTMAEIKRLFRPFTQANVTIASRFGGAGLGLSSVKQLARAMGGDITVAPRPGGGATFTLTVSVCATGSGKSRKSKGEAEMDAVPALRLLSVEDNPFGRVVLNTILTELGHHAEFIGRGEDAVNRLAQGAFDAVLMDMVLPGINGVEAIRRIRTMATPLAQIPIIGVSGRGEDEVASREAGADAFLVKPVSPRALATALLAATRREEAAT
ncbi:signal transduction histidine kinase/ActR/RegA family two-component response regulator [Bradyrhizobium sp. USDA 3686]|uniref:histidine kinase n=1 Tax=Bradyrhizobium canariense TaxID=255045 RepID=A0A1X3FLD5_9BRAD|nr:MULTISPECIES: ATP-binding protein [Bradyrhizobium]OSI61774.1 hybrid sensor histidine kinase/response regulator [Bradyrhizobium canariense]OSI67465.1 hybrid sensor histidine kinase/response regulator [Bradyrhizobium canariense]OSI77302.1 hybrid sensor histidine kinase/response regulator [Bradyrhizobium canariense]OSI87194.1 hybrid sensor histidine kinase/response regulator [Bradyrhizobium canariense]OSI88390.1 hybrid sensor histidine kinase/response regulator [Bradyrhizobium canariense]